MAIDNQAILATFEHHLQMIYARQEVERRSAFSLADLVGKTIAEYRSIPSPHSFPHAYDVLIFTDGTYLLGTLRRGMADPHSGASNATLYSLYFDGTSVKVSSRIFDPW